MDPQRSFKPTIIIIHTTIILLVLLIPNQITSNQIWSKLQFMYKLTILQPYLCPLTKTRTCIYIHNTTACEKLNVRIVVNGEQWSE